MENENLNAPSSPDANPYLIPASVIVAGVLVAFAVLYTSGGPGAPRGQEALVGNNASGAEKIRPVDSSDHILGNPKAAVKIIEYSDLECPFCKTYHPTLKRIMDEYGKEGRVAWVYRHFPLDSIHPKARKEAEASECAAELGGNNVFWAYIDKVFEVTPSNNRLEASELPKIAGELGLDRAKFESCLSSGRWAERVEKNLKDAINSGGDGTPYTVIITASGKKIPFAGALPYAQVKRFIDEALASL